MTRPNPRWFLSKLPLAIILLSGAFVRFYDLGTLPLRWDELLVPMAARHSLAYIFNLCSTQETHPPLFYCITKAVLLISSGDIALRFVSALFGTVSIYLLYRIGREFFDEETGLFAAAFLCINILHFLLSREARPYSLQTAFFIATFWLIARLLKRGQWKDLLLLCCVNFLLFWLHYFAYYMVAAQGIVLALCLFIKSSRVTYRQFAVFCVFTALAAVPIYIWFVVPSLAHQLSGPPLPEHARQHYLWIILRDLLAASVFASTQFSWSNLMYLAPLAGWVLCVPRKPKFAALCLALGGIPFAILLAQVPGYPLGAYHAVWITPLFSLCAAMLIFRLPRAKAAVRRSLWILAPLLAVSGSFLIFIHRHEVGFKDFSVRYDLRTTAQRLAPMLSSEALTTEAFTPGFFSALSWYMDQFPPNPLTTQQLDPGSAPVTLHFLSGRADVRNLVMEDAETYLHAAMAGLTGKITRLPFATVYTFQLDRQPTTAIGSLPASFTFSADPKAFYSRVYRLRNVRSVPGYTIDPQYPILSGFRTSEGGVIATVNNQPVFFEFVLENTRNNAPMRISTELRYADIGSDSRIGLYASFDNEPIQTLATRTGPDPSRALTVDLSRDKPFKRLTFLVGMYCNDHTALLLGDNLRTLIFQGLSVNIVEAGGGSGAAPFVHK